MFNVVSRDSHENAGVTPGLRRRRERAERQKSFLQEQQEAAASGLRPFNIKHDMIKNQGKMAKNKIWYCKEQSPSFFCCFCCY